MARYGQSHLIITRSQANGNGYSSLTSHINNFCQLIYMLAGCPGTVLEIMHANRKINEPRGPSEIHFDHRAEIHYWCLCLFTIFPSIGWLRRRTSFILFCRALRKDGLKNVQRWRPTYSIFLFSRHYYQV